MSDSTSTPDETRPTLTGAAEAEAEAEAEAPPVDKFKFSVLPQFLNNIKTVDELKDVASKISMTTSPTIQTEPEEEQDETVLAESTEQLTEQPESEKHLHHGSGSTFGVDHGVMESLLDVTASLQLRDGSGRLSTTNSSLVLVSRMRHGHSFADEVAIHLAKELDSCLVSIGDQDLEDLAQDFWSQEEAARRQGRLPETGDDDDQPKPLLDSFNGLSSHYFASRTRRKTDEKTFQHCMDSFSVLLDAINAKNTAQPGDSDSDSGVEDETKLEATGTGATGAHAPPPPPVIIHFQDAKAVMEDYHFGRKLITRLRDAVNQRREKGENMTLMISVTHGDSDEAGITPRTADACSRQVEQCKCWQVKECQCWLCKCRDPRTCDSRGCGMMFPTRKLGLSPVMTTVLMPSCVPREWPAPTRKKSRGRTVHESNVNRLKRTLRAQLLRSYTMTPPDLLEVDHDWFEFLSEDVREFLRREDRWDEKGIEDAAIRFIGRCVRRKTLSAADIPVLLARMLSDEDKEREEKEEKDKEEEEKPSEEQDSEEQDSEEAVWKNKLATVAETCDDKEKELISHVINPGRIETTFDHVILDTDVLNTIKTLVHLSQLRPEAASQALVAQIKIKGAMLYGPPGTGKTHLARAVAKSTGFNMLSLDASTVNSKYVGETEKYIRAAFTLAAKLFPCIIFMDEVDALFYRRSSCDRSWQRSAITQFLQSMDGLNQDGNAPFVLVATNRPSDLDGAFLRRLPQKIPFGLPSAAARAGILRLFLREEDLDDGVDVDKLAARTEGFTGSDLKSLCGEAGLMWAMEQQLGLEQNAQQAKAGLAAVKEKEQEQEQEQERQGKDSPGSDMAVLQSDAPASSDGQSSTAGSSTAGSDTLKSDTPSPKSVQEPKLKLRLTNAHFDKACGRIRPSVTEQDLKELEDFARKFSPAKTTMLEASSHEKNNIEKKSVNEEGKSNTGASNNTGTSNNTNGVSNVDDEADSPLVDPMPILNPPEGCTRKARLPCSYSPLPTPTSIRLIKLHSIPKRPKEHMYDTTQKYATIHCSLVVVDMEQDPDYFALSYTWGDPRTIYTDKRDIFPPEHWSAPAFDIVCDGKPVSVATNLYTALISIRSSLSNNDYAKELGPKFQPHDPSGSYIWIDALCINQDDVSERNQQVKLMERVYTQARATIMWLGGGELMATYGAPGTVQKLSRLVDRLRQDVVDSKNEVGKDDDDDDDDDEALWQRCRSFNLSKPESYAEVGLEPILPGELVGYYLFISRSWFKRAWVVQEWALSHTCTFVCGAVAMNPASFWDRVLELTRSEWLFQIQDIVKCNVVDVETGGVPAWNVTPGLDHRCITASPGKWRGVPELFRACYLDNDFSSDWGGTVGAVTALRMGMGHGRALEYPPSFRPKAMKMINDLQFTIHDFRTTRAVDPRDKVFAFYSLLKDDQGRHLYPAPDYNKTVTQVYTEAAGVMIKQIGAASLVYAGVKDGNPYQLPSWVPDFSQETGGLFLQDSPVFAASQGLGLEGGNGVVVDGDVLRVAGCRIDRVVHAQDEPLGAGVLVDGFRGLIRLLCHLPHQSMIGMPLQKKDGQQTDEEAQSTKLQEQSRFEVLWRTILQDSHGNHLHPAPDFLGDLYMRRLRAFLLLQMSQVLEQDVGGILRDAVVQAGKPEGQGDPFFVHVTERLGTGETGILTSIKLRAGNPHLEKPLEKPFCRESEVSSILEINAILAMLDNTLPFDSEARPENDLWTGCQHLWRDALRAYKARDLDQFQNSLYGCMGLLASSDPNPQEIRSVGGFIDNRKLFATTGGRLGINPGGVVDGDEIWLVPGLHVPIALRSQGSARYQVVGCVYLHGVMHGEAATSMGTKLNVIDLA